MIRMGHSEIILYLGLFATFGWCLADPNEGQKPLLRKVGSDRSVYARRSYALPDVNSDVYEVYVGQPEFPETSRREAVAVLQSQSQSGVQGTIKFVQEHPNDPVTIEGSISGLAAGLHGFHVHTNGNLTNGCTSTGGHFNPYNQTHGAPTDKIRHVGDLGNVLASASGVATIKFTDHVISLSGINSILGRGNLVHQKQDDLGRGNNPDSKLTGNAGARLACGVIGVA